MSSETEQAPRMETQKTIEKEQEAKLRQKYPGLRGPGSSAFLQKRLSKGQKYFDSGDYNMAKAKGAMPPPSSNKVPTATAQKPPGIVKPTVVEPPVMTEATGDAIPTPESLPQRKPSLVQSKLVTETTS